MIDYNMLKPSTIAAIVSDLVSEYDDLTQRGVECSDEYLKTLDEMIEYYFECLACCVGHATALSMVYNSP